MREPLREQRDGLSEMSPNSTLPFFSLTSSKFLGHIIMTTAEFKKGWGMQSWDRIQRAGYFLNYYQPPLVTAKAA